MVEGVVNSRLEAIVTLTVRGPSGLSRVIDAVIDTGFSEFLTVPPELATELELDYLTLAEMVLADGSVEKFDVFKLMVMWDGHSRQVEAHVPNSIPLAGMGMLEDHDLHVEVRKGDKVLIESPG